jgi:hypothetical protein
MLGKVQFELQKLLDSYVSGYIFILLILFDIVMDNTFHSSFYLFTATCISAVSYIPDDYKSIRILAQ